MTDRTNNPAPESGIDKFPLRGADTTPDWGSPKALYGDYIKMAAANVAGDTTRVNAAATMPPRDLSRDFDIGTKPLDIASFNAKHGELFQGLTAATEKSGAVQSGVDGYTARAYGQMISKYGPQRVGEVLSTLNDISGNPQKPPSLKAYQSEFWTSPGGDPKELNRVLYNIADLMQPGRREKLRDVADNLRKEGYTKRLSLSEMSPKFIDALGEKSEREALINFDSSPNVRQFLAANRDYAQYAKHKPSEMLAAYENWNRTHK